MQNQKNNKQNAMAFYELMFNQNQPEKAIQEYVGDSYTQHNPHVEDGKEGFIRYFKRMQKDYPEKRVFFKKVIAEGDKVVLHCHQVWPDDLEYAGIDIFRFDDHGKIVEHWDVLQVIPDKMAHGNGMF
jgi:predicted SnoaL-like aldol condensation-catalyzing enzyme